MASKIRHRPRLRHISPAVFRCKSEEAVVMWTFNARVAAMAVGIGLVLGCNQPHAFARGSQVGHDDPWNADRIQRLPPEVRNAVNRICADTPRAGHYFA